MFARAGSIDRNDHSLISQPTSQTLSRLTNFSSTSSNHQQQQQQQQQQGPPPPLLSQNAKSFHTNQQQTSSSNHTPFYPPPNQYGRQSTPIGGMNTANNRQQIQQHVPSLMSGITKVFPNNGNNFNNTPPLFPHRQPSMNPQSNNNRPLYQHHTPYSNYAKLTVSNDDNVKPKHT